jgi:hypothetical protein
MGDEFVHVRRVTADSLQGRIILAAGRVARRAWHDSRLHALIDSARRDISRFSIPERTRMAAVVVGIAATTNAAARTIVPPYTAPALPIPVILAIAVLALAVAAAPDAFVKAWGGSRIWRSKQRRG